MLIFTFNASTLHAPHTTLAMVLNPESDNEQEETIPLYVYGLLVDKDKLIKTIDEKVDAEEKVTAIYIRDTDTSKAIRNKNKRKKDLSEFEARCDKETEQRLKRAKKTSEGGWCWSCDYFSSEDVEEDLQIYKERDGYEVEVRKDQKRVWRFCDDFAECVREHFLSTLPDDDEGWAVFENLDLIHIDDDKVLIHYEDDEVKALNDTNFTCKKSKNKKQLKPEEAEVTLIAKFKQTYGLDVEPCWFKLAL